MVRVLVTGSRDWESHYAISYALNYIEVEHRGESHTLVSGACPTGADFIAELVAKDLGWEVERHPADWKSLGKKAGFVRNAEMVDLGADICVAFIKDQSKGATMTADLAEKKGIKTLRYKI